MALPGCGETQPEWELRMDAWHTEARSQRQTCIDEVDFDAGAQPGDDPQNGQ